MSAHRTAESETVERLVRLGWRLAAAESCTGGALLARWTAVPGASRAIWGGAVVYSSQAKLALTGMDGATLERHGAVSEETTRALAEGIRERAGVELGLAITGWAGPESDGPDPVGTVYLGIVAPAGTRVTRETWRGSRGEIRARAVDAMLTAVRDLLREET